MSSSSGAINYNSIHLNLVKIVVDLVDFLLKKLKSKSRSEWRSFVSPLVDNWN